MAKKEYQVAKATVKLDGVEYGPGDVVALEPSQADALLGVFVEEYVPTETKRSSSASAAAKKNDGL